MSATVSPQPIHRTFKGLQKFQCRFIWTVRQAYKLLLFEIINRLRQLGSPGDSVRKDTLLFTVRTRETSRRILLRGSSGPNHCIGSQILSIVD